ncbi:hypothetical protein G5714_024557 [Onychostoma macrolepis]|uniref:Transmembrane protein n=1 Tax=Onychostoma macrolepis TaxID=369639 RepID=A0A7J6BK02_9TELE|nr:hypothetical protein G5714_024557 [Onychostoma macrolepis]
MASDFTSLKKLLKSQSDRTENNSQCPNTQQSLIIVYFIPNIVMFLATIGLFQFKLQECKKRCQRCRDEKLEHLYSTNDDEFSDVSPVSPD